MAFFYAMDLVRKNGALPDFKLCAVIKGRRYCWTENHNKLQVLMEALALEEASEPSHGEAAEPGQFLVDYTRSLHKRLQEASERENFRLSNSSYVRAHLVRKLLVLRLQKDREWDTFARLSWQNALALELPDEDGFIAAVPEKLRNVGMLEAALSCPPVMLSCFACLAKPALKKNPGLLTSLNKEQVAKDLDDYVTLHGFQPSLERLFSWRSTDDVEKRPSLPELQESSDESL